MSEYSGLETLDLSERFVARAATTWRTADSSVWLQIINPSSRCVKIPRSLILAFLSASTATGKLKVQVNAGTTSPENLEELVAARIALEPALARAFVDSAFTPEHIAEVTHLCAEYRPVFLSPYKLGCCKIARFPCAPGTRPMDRAPLRTSPHVQEKVDELVTKLLKQGIIEKRTSAWSSPVAIVTKAGGSPRFCVDFRNTVTLFEGLGLCRTSKVIWTPSAELSSPQSLMYNLPFTYRL